MKSLKNPWGNNIRAGLKAYGKKKSKRIFERRGRSHEGDEGTVAKTQSDHVELDVTIKAIFLFLIFIT